MASSDQEKADVFAERLFKVSQPHSTTESEVADIFNLPNFTSQRSITILPVKTSEIRQTINTSINTKESPGYDLITDKIEELSKKGIMLLTATFTAVLRIDYFPSQGKIVQMILVQKYIE